MGETIAAYAVKKRMKASGQVYNKGDLIAVEEAKRLWNKTRSLEDTGRVETVWVDSSVVPGWGPEQESAPEEKQRVADDLQQEAQDQSGEETSQEAETNTGEGTEETPSEVTSDDEETSEDEDTEVSSSESSGGKTLKKGKSSRKK